MYRLNTQDEGRWGKESQSLVLSYPAGIVALTTQGGKKQGDSRQRCQSNSRRRDDGGVLSVQCVFPTCYNDIVTSFLFSLLRRWDFFPCLLPPAVRSVSTWWYKSLLFYEALYHHGCSDFYCSGNFQGWAWGCVERKKKKKKTQSATATVFFFDPLHVITRKMGREKKGKNKITFFDSLWGLWTPSLLCCNLNAPSALTSLHLQTT